MKNLLKHRKIWEVIIVFLLSLTPLLWLKEGEMILGHDSGFRLNPFQHLLNLFYSWDSISNFGIDWSVFKGFLITQLPETILTLLTGSLASGEKLSFVFWFFAIGISIYTLINSFFPQKEYWIFRLSSAAFYMYNFFLLQGWFIAERAKFSLYAALPLGFLVIYRTLTKYYSPLKGLVLFCFIAFFLNGAGNPTLYGTLLIVYSLEFLYLTFINYLQNGVKEVFYSIKIGILFIVGFLFINAYWAFPQFYLLLNRYGSSISTAGGIEGIINWEAVVNKYASFINLFRLQGIPDWYNNSSHIYANEFLNNPLFIFLSFIPVLIIIFGFFYHKHFPIKIRNDRLFYLFFGLYLIGLLFSAGSHPPLGFLYLLLVKNIPGFAIFRSVFYKFGTILWFASVFLTGYYINLFIIKLVRNKKWINIIGFIPIIFILLYHYPYFTGEFFDWSKPFTTKLRLPEYVRDASDYLNLSAPSNSRILLLPSLDPSFQADSYDWGFFSLDLLPRLSINRSIIANDNNSPTVISDIYSTIAQNNQLAFLRLSGLTGINKVLWRGDVLYSDKKTRSGNLSLAEENLSHFNGVSLDKQFGRWKIYNIDSPYYLPLFYIPAWTIYSQSQESFIGDILNRDIGIVEPVVLFSDFPMNESRKVEPLLKENIIEATCIMCEPNEFENKEQSINIFYVRLLPDSPFYFLVSLREQRQIDSHKDNPVQMIDIDLGLANKRLAEIKQMVERYSKDKSKNLISETFIKYKSLIDDVIERSSKLPEDSQNAALIKILYYLRGQYRFLSLVEDKQGLAEEELDDLSIFIQDLINNLSSNRVWMTSSARDQFRYIFSLNNEGAYDIHINEIKGTFPIKIVVDNKELGELKNNHFSAGTHKLSLTYNTPANLLDLGEATQSGTLDLTMGKIVKLAIRDFTDQDTYSVSFDYKIVKGKPGLSIIEGKGDSSDIKRIRLEQNSIWNSFSYSLKPQRDSTYIYLQFYSKGFNPYGAKLEIRGLKVIKTFTPEVFLSSNLSSTAQEVPQISFREVDQTKYIVHVENANGPYILNFGQSYDKGWKASVFTEPLPEETHFKTNGYANGWLVDKTGSYDIIIEYWPQRLVYIGFGISITAIFGFLLILIFRLFRGLR